MLDEACRKINLDTAGGGGVWRVAIVTTDVEHGQPAQRGGKVVAWTRIRCVTCVNMKNPRLHCRQHCTLRHIRVGHRDKVHSSGQSRTAMSRWSAGKRGDEQHFFD